MDTWHPVFVGTYALHTLLYGGYVTDVFLKYRLSDRTFARNRNTFPLF
jgi:hypothetical protein